MTFSTVSPITTQSLGGEGGVRGASFQELFHLRIVEKGEEGGHGAQYGKRILF